MGFLSQYGLFLFKAVTIVSSVLILVAGILSLSRKAKSTLEIIPLNQDYETQRKQLQKIIFGKIPKQKKSKKNKSESKKKLYVIDFNGDIKASQVQSLRSEVSAILSVAKPEDEVVVRLESPGGAVNGYGLAASQLQRLRDQNLNLTICIDKVAASGGYLMACVAHKIIAAPFAIIGSIGVVAQLPNFHRWLKKQDIDVEILTAGEYKRTLTLFGENTEKGRKKFIADLEQIHQQFRDYVLANRNNLNIEQVATGEHWLGSEALQLSLVDEIQTSDDYILNKITTHDAYQIIIHTKQTWLTKLLAPATSLLYPVW